MKGPELDELELVSRAAIFLNDPALQWWEVINTQEDMDQDEAPINTRNTNAVGMGGIPQEHV